MTRTHRMIAACAIAVSSTLLIEQRPAVAQSSEDICAAVGCSSGTSKCADVTGVIRDDRCEDGVMCCPFPEEWVTYFCKERLAAI